MNTNPTLVSLPVAREFVKALNLHKIGGGVLPEKLNEDGSPNLEAWEESGLYLPPWTPVDSSPVPEFRAKKMYMAHFANGVAGISIAGMMNLWRPGNGRTPENNWIWLGQQIDELGKQQP